MSKRSQRAYPCETVLTLITIAYEPAAVELQYQKYRSLISVRRTEKLTIVRRFLLR